MTSGVADMSRDFLFCHCSLSQLFRPFEIYAIAQRIQKPLSQIDPKASTCIAENPILLETGRLHWMSAVIENGGGIGCRDGEG